jgi:DNA-binding XRE family transcriptional regulator
MPAKTPELIQARIKKLYAESGNTIEDIAQICGVSTGTVKRVVKENNLSRTPTRNVNQVVTTAIAAGAKVTIDGLDVNDYMTRTIKTLAGAVNEAEAKSLEGVATALARYLQLYREMNPTTLEEATIALLNRPDFDAQTFHRILQRHAEKAG